VRVSPISRGAAILIMIIGVLTFFWINPIAGIVFFALGVLLYWLLYRFTRRLAREVREAGALTRKSD
jgi:membrane protein implicated in regulation of membrane protease activity